MALTLNSQTHPSPPQNPKLPANPSIENLTNSVQNLNLSKNSVSTTDSYMDPQLLYRSSSKTQQDQCSSLQDQDCSDVNFGYELIRLANDRDGSKKLQEILLLKDPYNTCLVLKWATSLSSNGAPYILYLMDHEFGSKVYAKLVDSCNEEQLAMVVSSVTRKKELFLRLSLTNDGAGCIKKLVKALKRSDYVAPLVKCLSFFFSEIMTNRIGSYVISECMEQLKATRTKLLSTQAVNLCLNLATHQEGCISLNRIIDSISGADRMALLEIISCNAVFLSYDPAGNFVVQKVLDLQDPTWTEIICSNLKGNYINLSSLVRGSHVVEKCLKSSSSWYYCVDELTNDPKKLLQIARDKVGNYVVQTALKVSKQRHSLYHQRLVTALRPNIRDLQFSFGRNVYSLVVNEGGVLEA